MPYVLNSYRTQDIMTDAGTLHCPLSVSLTVTVKNAPVLAQFAPTRREHGDIWEPEQVLLQGVHSFAVSLTAVRFRSALNLMPALVIAEARKHYE